MRGAKFMIFFVRLFLMYCCNVNDDSKIKFSYMKEKELLVPLGPSSIKMKISRGRGF